MCEGAFLYSILVRSPSTHATSCYATYIDVITDIYDWNIPTCAGCKPSRRSTENGSMLGHVGPALCQLRVSIPRSEARCTAVSIDTCPPPPPSLPPSHKHRMLSESRCPRKMWSLGIRIAVLLSIWSNKKLNIYLFVFLDMYTSGRFNPPTNQPINPHEGSPCWRFYARKVLCSEVYMFRMFYRPILKFLYSIVLCSEGRYYVLEFPCFGASVFQSFYISKAQCSEG